MLARFGVLVGDRVGVLVGSGVALGIAVAVGRTGVSVAVGVSFAQADSAANNARIKKIRMVRIRKTIYYLPE